MDHDHPNHDYSDHALPAHHDEPPSPSNGLRLRGREWLLATTLTVLAVAVAPRMSTVPETARDYRIPHELNEDYWLFARVAAQSPADVLVFGDSVMWGAYVRREQTLSAHLSGEKRVDNMGLQGLHPAALAGLLTYYATDIRDKAVILHLNPLWLSSPRLDLQESKEFRFNHPELVPQFDPWLPCYQATVSDRIGNVVRRTIGFAQWTRHLQKAYFEQRDLPSWTIEHPYESPLAALLSPIPEPAPGPQEKPTPWTERDMKPRAFDWVDLEHSFQWASFRSAIEILRARGNRVFVLVGPFNEHLLTPEGLVRYRVLRDGIATWLRQNGIPHSVPAALPSQLFADASHPLAEGYAQLANKLVEGGALRRLN